MIVDDKQWVVARNKRRCVARRRARTAMHHASLACVRLHEFSLATFLCRFAIFSPRTRTAHDVGIEPRGGGSQKRIQSSKFLWLTSFHCASLKLVSAIIFLQFKSHLLIYKCLLFPLNFLRKKIIKIHRQMDLNMYGRKYVCFSSTIM